MTRSPAFHTPVMLDEVLDLFTPVNGAVYVDGTLGAGGHAAALLAAEPGTCVLYGIDRDPVALRRTTETLARFGDRFRPVAGNHRDLPSLVRARGEYVLDGILLDLGVSSMQLDDPERGFSFRDDGPLDMRMDPSSGSTAAELVATLDEDALARILDEYGEEKLARRIARAIVRRRETRPIERTRDLADLVTEVAGPAARRYRIHPATRTFQALRIAVNDEIDGLYAFVQEAFALLRPGARMAVISFHSLEDRAVKRAFRDLAERCICPPDFPVCGCGRQNLARLVTRRALRPGAAEVERNPRSRSARLRAAERIR